MELSKDQQAALAVPFSPDQVSWRVQGKPTPNTRMQVVCYVDARDVQDRLDATVGASNWYFDWTPIVTNTTGLLVAKGTITILGVSKSDVGDASSIEGTKGAVSDAFKRTAVMWGIGRELYGLGYQEATLDKYGHILAQELVRLSAVLTGQPIPAQPQDEYHAASQAQATRPPAKPSTQQPPKTAAQASGTVTVEDRKAQLVKRYEDQEGYKGAAAWNQLVIDATEKTKETLQAQGGLTHADLNKVAQRLDLLKRSKAREQAQAAQKAQVSV